MKFFSTANAPANLLERSFAANIARIYPNGTAPLFAYTGMAQKKFAKAIEHGYWQKRFQMLNLKLAVAIAATGTTSFQFVSAQGVLPGHLIRYSRPFSGGVYQAPEFVLVTAVNYATNTATVIRGFTGTTPLAAISTAAEGIVVGNAWPEGSSGVQPRAIIPTYNQNYTQIFRNAWRTSGTLAAVEAVVGKGNVQENKDDAMMFHAQEIEMAILFGRKHMGTDPSSGEPIHTMDGLEAMIQGANPAAIKEAGATTNYTQLCNLCDDVFDTKSENMKSGNKRLVVAGKTAYQVINRIGQLSGNYQLVQDQNEFGLQFTTFKTARGEFDLIEHPLLQTSTETQKMAIITDLSSFDLLALKGRDTEIREINPGKSTDTVGADWTGGIITSEYTMECQNPWAMGIIYNLTAGAAG